MEKHKAELFKKSKMGEKEFNSLLRLLLQKVVIVPNEVLKPYRDEAFEVVKKLDPNDVIFVACALAYSESVIWSDDKILKKQERVKVFNTKGMVRLVQV